tara:strand:- start:391 stop:897 length:507 start_codon:yes stop_codon:yes gene_type:complete
MSQVEQQNYKTLNVIDNIEIREYPPTIYASVTLKDINDKNMFSILAGYIFGGNENNQKIAMTAPVHMHQNENEKSSTMSFVMPSKYNINELSKPNDERIEITKSVTKRYAALSYTGYNNSEKFNKYKSELQNKLDEEKIITLGNHIYLGYDPPYKFWNRKNEVLIEIN